MRQVWISRAGSPEVLQVRNAPEPTVSGGDVRIRVAFAGINFADILARMGQYPDAPKLPCVVGYEVSGIVDAVGPDAPGFEVGQRVVAITRFNGYSEVLAVPAAQVLALPENYPLDKAAAIPVNYLTAWLMLVRMANVQAGDRVLVHTAGGGVGQAALQICRWQHAEVIGTASSSKHTRLRELGVAQCIDYTRESVPEAVARITAGRGVDIVLDPIGGRSFKEGYRMLAPMGRLCMFGASSSAPGTRRSIAALLRTLVSMPFFHPMSLINENKAVIGINLGHLWREMDKLRSDFETIRDLCIKGTFDPVVDRAFSFEQAADAHRYMQDRKNVGKVLLKP